MIKQPDFISDENGNKIELYQHQLKSVFELENLEKTKQVVKGNLTYRTNIGFFRDIAGYGKTLSMCTLLARDHNSDYTDWNIETPYEKKIVSSISNNIYSEKIIKYKKCDCSLIVCSPNIVHQWAKELDRCKLVYHIIKNKKSTEILTIDNMNENYQVILIDSNYLYYFNERFHSYVFRRFIFDEVADLKIALPTKISEILADFYWFISATIYKNLYTRYHRYDWIKNLIPHTYGCVYDDISIMNEPAFILSSIKLPKPRYFSYSYHGNVLSVKFSSFFPSYISKMIANGNIKEVSKIIGIREEENIFDAIVRLQDQKIASIQLLSPGPRRVEKLAKARNEKENIIARIKGCLDDNCQCDICYSDIKNIMITPCCYHSFCPPCILGSIDRIKSCPICRSIINPKQIITNYHSSSDQYSSSTHIQNQEQEIKNQVYTAIDIINKIFSSPLKRQILFFSDFEDVFSPIRMNVDENKQMRILKGQIKTRENIISEFRSGKIDLLYINSITNMSGMNLQNCTDIILFHKMEKQQEDQIIARAIRIGCDHDVNIHQLVNTNL